jgi:hypothetical protein
VPLGTVACLQNRENEHRMADPANESVIAPAPPMPAGPLAAIPAADGDPITDIDALELVSPEVAALIKSAAGLDSATVALSVALETATAALPAADSPGTERWPVKTGQDADRAKVGKNVLDGNDLGAGIVATTVEELSSLPRPPGLTVLTQDPPEFQQVRDGVTEVTIWQLEAGIIALKHEQDGDYHLVLQGESGGEMVAEVPTPTNVFVGDSPWLNNIREARQQVDQKLVHQLSAASFTLVNGKYLPLGAMTSQPGPPADPSVNFETPTEDSLAIQPLFATKIDSTPVRITGVGFFDRAHRATGAAPNVIELHPVLKVEWLPTS